MPTTSENVPAQEAAPEEVAQEQAPAAAAAAAAAERDTPYDEQDEKAAEGGEGEEEEEEETCGFCIFMKGGGCKDAFVAWSSCVDRERDAGHDFTEECREATLRLRECMLDNKEYYSPLLEEEEREMEAARQAAEEAAAAAGEGGEDEVGEGESKEAEESK